MRKINSSGDLGLDNLFFLCHPLKMYTMSVSTKCTMKMMTFEHL